MLSEFLKKDLKKEKLKNIFFGADFVSNLLLALVIFLPLFYLPLKFSTLTSSKLTLVFSVVFVSIVVVLINFFRLGKIKLSLNILSVSIFLIIVSYTLSSIFSQNVNISFFGRDLSLDSWATVVCLFTLLCLFRKLFKKEHVMFAIVGTVFVSGIISAFQILNILIPTIPSLGIFYSPIHTSLGKWYDLSLFSTLGLVFTVLILEQIKIANKFKRIFYVIGFMNLSVILFINASLSFYVLIPFGIIFSIYKVFNYEKAKVSFFAISIVVISVVYMFFGSAVSQKMSLFLNVNNVEVRPSVITTYQVTRDSLLNSNLYLGSGPASFESRWPIYRPTSILQTNYWNLDFRYGAGVVSSFVATTGVVGAAVWVIFFVILIILFIKSLLFKNKDDHLKFILTASAFASIILWVFSILYITSAVLYVMAFIFTGIFFSLVEDLNFIKKTNFVVGRFLTFLIALFLFLISSFVAYKTYTKFIGQVYFQKSIQMSVSAGDYDEMERVVKKAQQFDNVDTYQRSLGEIYSVNFYQVVQSAETSDVTSESLKDLIQKVISSYEKAIEYDPGNYNNYFGLANFYSTLVPLEIPGSKQASLNAYAKVLELKPNNPLLFLQMAKLASFDDEILAEELIKKSISLKPNYFDAVHSLVQFDLEKGNIDKGIDLLEKYLASYPQDLEAKYKAGVIYFKIKDFKKSIEQFEILAQEYPDNLEIKSILEKLKTGN